MIRTRRFCDPALSDDGFRLLVTRYRPRGVKKEDESWDFWDPALAPSRALHADAYGKAGEPIAWDEYRRRYVAEMESQWFRIQGLANRHKAGETITLLCSAACTDEARCHRSILRELIESRS